MQRIGQHVHLLVEAKTRAQREFPSRVIARRRSDHIPPRLTETPDRARHMPGASHHNPCFVRIGVDHVRTEDCVFPRVARAFLKKHAFDRNAYIAKEGARHIRVFDCNRRMRKWRAAGKAILA